MKKSKITLTYILASLMLLTTLGIKAQEAENVPSYPDSKFTFEAKALADSTNNNEISVRISVPILKGEKVAADKINQFILAFVGNSLQSTYDYEMETAKDKPATYEEIVKRYLSGAQKENTEDVDYAGEPIKNICQSVLEGTIICSNAKIVNISIINYAYTGGAHGNANISSLMFDATTGEVAPLTLKTLTTDYKKFMEIAEKNFREAYEIEAEASLNSKGFWFENDKFRLSNKLLVLPEGLFFVYGQYEIAPYAMGMPEVFIPYEDLKSILNFDAIGITPQN